MAKSTADRMTASPTEAPDHKRAGRPRCRVRPHPRRSHQLPMTRFCPTAPRCARGPRRSDGLALRPTLRRGKYFRQPIRSGGRKLSVRTLRHQPSHAAALRARYQCPGHDLEDTIRFDCRLRRLDDRSRDHEDKITPHTRPPADEDADHLLCEWLIASKAMSKSARLRACLRLRSGARRMDRGRG